MTVHIKNPTRLALVVGGTIFLGVVISFEAAGLYALGALVGSFSVETC